MMKEKEAMAILAECPRCHKKQATKNRNCVCGADLVKEKRLKKVRYWVVYRLADGKQRKEFVKLPDGRPAGIEEAQAAEGKRKAQKVENPAILERVPAERMTFTELSEWYLELNPVKKLASFNRIRRVRKLQPGIWRAHCQHLETPGPGGLPGKAGRRGQAPATIDMEISLVKTMVTKAFDNDLVDGRTVKAFGRSKGN